ncbi:hypothetical protein AG1IA_07331 [Rhizoctonia solani AG-1 IA]|uniref:Uncharacterized protein n=1 Tax=Thanatephorus cucumeris (strain AG1-IA) TaxID=983506 RepID=L8WQL9_THACA|nr:hypothetical protein AG1IA_07331 [Rhizoctonia solani AG-1 IA]
MRSGGSEIIVTQLDRDINSLKYKITGDPFEELEPVGMNLLQSELCFGPRHLSCPMSLRRNLQKSKSDSIREGHRNTNHGRCPHQRVRKLPEENRKMLMKSTYHAPKVVAQKIAKKVFNLGLNTRALKPFTTTTTADTLNPASRRFNKGQARGTTHGGAPANAPMLIGYSHDTCRALPDPDHHANHTSHLG